MRKHYSIKKNVALRLSVYRLFPRHFVFFFGIRILPFYFKKKKKESSSRPTLRLRLDPLFWESILGNAFLLECIFENTLSRMYFAEKVCLVKY
jgi:hypothetical protein